jgi:hypothetical protein
VGIEINWLASASYADGMTVEAAMRFNTLT